MNFLLFQLREDNFYLSTSYLLFSYSQHNNDNILTALTTKAPFFTSITQLKYFASLVPPEIQENFTFGMILYRRFSQLQWMVTHQKRLHQHALLYACYFADLEICNFLLTQNYEIAEKEICLIFSINIPKLWEWLHSQIHEFTLEHFLLAIKKGTPETLLWLRPYFPDESFARAHSKRKILLAAFEEGKIDKLHCLLNEYQFLFPVISPFIVTPAIVKGHLPLLLWLKNTYPQQQFFNSTNCTYAANSGHLNILRWLRQQNCPWDKNLCHRLALKEFPHVAEWIAEQN